MEMYIYDSTSGTPRCARHALVTKRNVCEIYPHAGRRGALFSSLGAVERKEVAMAVASASPPPFLIRLALYASPCALLSTPSQTFRHG
jgi:hypothetical protein